MSTYSIKDIEQLSGIKAHTIRIWEQRYNFVKPKRTDTNIRYYDDEDLKLLLNISLLKDNGHKISKLSKMRIDDLNMEVQKITEQHTGYHEQIQALTVSMIELNEHKFEKILSNNILRNGLEATLLNIINPFFSKIGILWQTGAISPAHEHFISNLVRQKIIVAIDGLASDVTSSKYSFLLFLPEGELHEISLLASSYFIQSNNHKVFYLGQNLPFDDLVKIYNVHNTTHIMSVFTSCPLGKNIQGYINKLSDSFPHAEILLSGFQLIGNDYTYPENSTLFQKMEDLLQYLTELK